MQRVAPSLLTALLAWSTCLGQGGLTWHTNPANGHTYALSGPMTWTQGETLAVQLGGHLATVRSQAEHDWLVQTFGAGAPEDTRIWIGFTDELVEGTWVWSSGEPVAYTHWGLWEPDNAGGNQDYGGLWLIPSSYGGGWRWPDEGPNARQAIVELVPPMATYSSIGVGCQGSHGVPSLGPVQGSLPRLGTAFQIEIAGLPPTLTVVLGALGFSATTWAGVPLPRDLGLLGMPGCTQFVSLDTSYFMLALTGTATWAVSIPTFPGLAGVNFYVQALVPDPAANVFGAIVTHAGVGTVGT